MKTIVSYLATFTGNVIVTLSSLLVQKINKALTRNRTRKRIKKEGE